MPKNLLLFKKIIPEINFAKRNLTSPLGRNIFIS